MLRETAIRRRLRGRRRQRPQTDLRRRSNPPRDFPHPWVYEGGDAEVVVVVVAVAVVEKARKTNVAVVEIEVEDVKEEGEEARRMRFWPSG